MRGLAREEHVNAARMLVSSRTPHPLPSHVSLFVQVRCSKEASKIFAPANQVYLIFFLTVRQCKTAKMQVWSCRCGCLLICKRSLQNSAHAWATQLWQQPEYKAQLSCCQRNNARTSKQFFASAIKLRLRLPQACSCGENVLDDTLECGSCNVSMPFCIVTGYHITKGDTTCACLRRTTALISPNKLSQFLSRLCSYCRFPARQKAWVSALKHDSSCPR